MWEKAEKYFWTLKYLKKSQLFYLVKNRLERGKKAQTEAKAPASAVLHLWMPGLDEAPEYLSRFCVEEILAGKVTLLGESGVPGGRDWKDSSKSHLWNFNLHYLEFLIPLAAAWRKCRDRKYYECFRNYCRRWIQDNHGGTGDGWHPYTISLRLTNLWICMDGFGEILRSDPEFLRELNNSMYAQYRHLQKKPELHLLGNHYFENLKAVMIGAVYFQEPDICKKYRNRFLNEIREQILPDGLHYERSLMYHKIILEDLMRLDRADQKSQSLQESLPAVIKRMADAAYSLESDMGKTLLFNDAGDNVARPLSSILDTLKKEFGTELEKKTAFPETGYYCLQDEKIKLVFDAGEIAPSYMPGHGHCDGLSFEVSLEGKPIFVNSGTGQYQGALRSYFRSTAAHNTVVIDTEEQSQCWGEHRVGRRITEVSGEISDTGTKVVGRLKTCSGKYQCRKLELREHILRIRDQVKGHADSYLHLAPEYEYVLCEKQVQVRKRDGKEEAVCEIQMMKEDTVQIFREGTICSYAPSFGKAEQIQVLKISWEGDGTDHEIHIKF